MPIDLHARPEVEAAMLRGPNPEYLAFALEMGLGAPADLSTPVMQRIAAVWRGPWAGATAFEDRFFATMRAAEAECPGLWLEIIGAPAQQMNYEKILYERHFAGELAAIEQCSSAGVRAARRKQYAAALHDYHRIPEDLR
ncbi:hypothetical protein OJ996_08985 [Luteolibacter sp. GHJ8]|uniref:Uncharacterized protein n=1 Tax=Luteolibacter rhizosphaerae TaxID=2989719 RepID=A0ABT3G1K2_9BACT|nr:hypothetical protein [Luteolibacter rhizosphaerae]MCW1913707.1 hypothetical protein [Luteolibacter rhizosphaerae]